MKGLPGITERDLLVGGETMELAEQLAMETVEARMDASIDDFFENRRRLTALLAAADLAESVASELGGMASYGARVVALRLRALVAQEAR